MKYPPIYAESALKTFNLGPSVFPQARHPAAMGS
jgi:hypothetical protein